VRFLLKFIEDPWRIPALGLWGLFFLTGLAPGVAYHVARQLGGVYIHRAMVNSPYLLTVALAAYIAVFCYSRSVSAGAASGEAQDKAIQVFVLGLAAFLPFNFLTLFTVSMIPYPETRVLIYSGGCAKVLSWIYLLSLILRYYLLDRRDAFARIPSLFFSTRYHRARHAAAPSDAPEADADRHTGTEKDTGTAREP